MKKYITFALLFDKIKFMESKEKWSLAAKYGLLLSLVTIAVSLLGILFENMPKFLNTLLSLAKWAAIIWLLYTFMKKYSQKCSESVSYGKSYKFGLTVCFLSAIVCTAYMYIAMVVIDPSSTSELAETMLLAFEESGVALPGMDYQSLCAMIPKVMIFSIFFDCMFWGLIIPAIIANYTKKENFFIDEDTFKTEE